MDTDTDTGTDAASVRRNTSTHRFELLLRGDVAGFLAYRERGAALELTHTEVDRRLEGRGLGTRLVGGALDDCRARGQKVIPSCSFVAAFLQRHPDYRDLVAS